MSKCKKLVEVKVNGKIYIIEEGIWSKLKHFISKAGSMEKGGKIFGRGKRTKAAGDQIISILGKKGNEMIKQVVDGLKQNIPDFPNNEDHAEFLAGTTEIGGIYDTVVARHDMGELPAPAANAIITDLRAYVEKLMDYDLSDVYKHMTEEFARSQYNWSLQYLNANRHRFDKKILNEIFGMSKVEKDLGALEKGEDPYAKKEPGAEGPLGGKGESQTWKGLESNLLPGLLAAGGAAALLGNSDWFQGLLKAQAASGAPVPSGTNILKIIEEPIQIAQGTPSGGQGITHFLGGLAHGDPTTFDASIPAKDFFNSVKQFGITPQDPGGLADMASKGAGPFKAAWGEMGNNLMNNPDITLGELFGAEAGGLGINPVKFFVPGVKKVLIRTAVGGAAKAGLGSTVAGTLGALAGSGALATLGLGAIAAGAAVKAIRMKGKKSSRAQVLNDLMASMKDVEPKSEAEEDVQQGLEAAGVIEPSGEEEGGVQCLSPEDQQKIKNLLNNLDKQKTMQKRSKTILRVVDVLVTNGFFSKDATNQFLEESIQKLLNGSQILKEIKRPELRTRLSREIKKILVEGKGGRTFLSSYLPLNEVFGLSKVEKELAKMEKDRGKKVTKIDRKTDVRGELGPKDIDPASAWDEPTRGLPSEEEADEGEEKECKALPPGVQRKIMKIFNWINSEKGGASLKEQDKAEAEDDIKFEKPFDTGIVPQEPMDEPEAPEEKQAEKEAPSEVKTQVNNIIDLLVKYEVLPAEAAGEEEVEVSAEEEVEAPGGEEEVEVSAEEEGGLGSEEQKELKGLFDGLKEQAADARNERTTGQDSGKEELYQATLKKIKELLGKALSTDAFKAKEVSKYSQLQEGTENISPEDKKTVVDLIKYFESPPKFNRQTQQEFDEVIAILTKAGILAAEEAEEEPAAEEPKAEPEEKVSPFAGMKGQGIREELERWKKLAGLLKG